MSELGRLRRVELRDTWQSEAQDFTPWLAREDNLTLLGETLGIDLELEAVEQNVGPFRADILCKDTLSDRWVLVENQLERTEHRAAMDWLNEITDSEVRFFALEVELWRIGDSPAAPKFNVVSKPNDWSRSTSAAKKAVAEGDLSPTRQMQREYWASIEDVIGNDSGQLRPVSPNAGSWVGHGIGKTSVSLNMSLNTRDNWARVEIYLSGRTAKIYFDALEKKRDAIEEAYGRSLDWQRLPEKTDARICDSINVNVGDRSDWPRQHRWLASHAQKFYDVFRPFVVELRHSNGGDISQ